MTLEEYIDNDIANLEWQKKIFRIGTFLLLITALALFIIPYFLPLANSTEYTTKAFALVPLFLPVYFEGRYLKLKKQINQQKFFYSGYQQMSPEKKEEFRIEFFNALKNQNITNL